MLSGESAQAELAKYTISLDGLEETKERLRAAPMLVWEIAAIQNDVLRPWEAVAQQIDDLAPAEREKVFGAFAPELGGDIARWWEWSLGQPYRRGWQDKRPFRSADRADSLPTRWHELMSLLRHGLTFPQPLLWHAEWALHLPGS